MFTLTARLLEYVEGEYEGNAYASVKLRADEVAEGSILKYKVDPKRVPNLKRLVDQEVEVELDVVRGQNDTAGLRIVRLVSDYPESE